METQGFPRPMGRGLRKLTTNHLAAARLAEQAPTLPAGVKHPNQLLAAMRRAAPFTGQTRLLPLMEALFRWTQPQDWAEGADPIVWPSNEELAHALDCSERHVSRLIATAIEARLLVARDGPDRRRRGLRQDGQIVWAWGLSLRPMAARHADFLRAIDDGERSRRECREWRRRAAASRQSITQLQALVESQGICIAVLDTYAAEARHICATLRRMERLDTLAAAAQALEATALRARAAVEIAVKDANLSGPPDVHVAPILLTNESFDSKESVAAQEDSARVDPAPGDPIAAQGPATSVSPLELVDLAPRLKACMPPGRVAWPGVSEAASVLAGQLGIPLNLYGEACGTLGRTPAAVAIAVISTKPHGYFHSAGAGGYLRGMLRRAARGELFLDRSIYGLRDGKQGGRTAQLTAVNTKSAVVPVAGGMPEMRYLLPNAFPAASASTLHE